MPAIAFGLGAATSAALAGLEDSTIQTLGRWQSAAFLQYNYKDAEGAASLVHSHVGCNGARTHLLRGSNA